MMIAASWIVFFVTLGALGAGVWFFSRRELKRGRIAAIVLGVVLLVSAASFGRDLAMQKLLSHLIMPSGLFWVGFGMFIVHLWATKPVGARDRLRVAGLGLFAFYTITGNAWLAGLATAELEDSIPNYPLVEGERFDAVFVLGGGATKYPGRNAQITDQGDRVLLGARLYKLGKTPILVTSGSTIPGIEEDVDLTRATLEIWRDLGVPEEAIRRIPLPKNTSQEIAAYKKMIDQEAWKKVGLISSAWHLPRIMRLARRAEMNATPIPADHRSGMPPFHPMGLIPQPSSANRLHRAAWEWVGMMVGR
jgi:uncharacterized SAM-binding protein YcdF (DUF218 family)